MVGQWKRRNRLSFEQRIWRFVRNQKEPVRPHMVAVQFGVSGSSASKALARLREKGCVTASGSTHTRLYSVTNKAPEDHRGLAVGTIDNLLKYSKGKPRVSVCIKQLTKPPRRFRGISLEEAWKSPISNDTQRTSEAPRNNEAATFPCKAQATRGSILPPTSGEDCAGSPTSATT